MNGCVTLFFFIEGILQQSESENKYINLVKKLHNFKIEIYSIKLSNLYAGRI